MGVVADNGFFHILGNGVIHLGKRDLSSFGLGSQLMASWLSLACHST